MERKIIKALQLFSNWVILGSILITPILILWKMEELETKITRPIVYQVDNAGGVMFGTITDKEIVDGRYTVTAGAYGKFLVTREQYWDLEIGDEIPDYLKRRGVESNDIKK